MSNILHLIFYTAYQQPSSTLRGEKAKAGDTACRVYLKKFAFRPQKGWAVVLFLLVKNKYSE